KLSNRLAAIESGRIIRVCPPMDFFSPQTLSGKLQLIGEVLSIEYDPPAYIVTLLTGHTIIKAVVSEQEASALHVGEKAIIASKAFNPILIPLS
ncbi:MAG TPA: ABC transporter ATP-binding protein, partial [Sulfuricurvum sp.]|nr:ABC transporter ATP-binding protein [Sulfuricurvum sp.]